MAISNVREFLNQLYGVATFTRASVDPSTIGTSAAQILRQDSRRIQAVIINLSSATMYLTPIGVPSSVNGVALPANGGVAVIDAKEDGETVAWEWDAVATAAASNYFAIETLIGGGA